MSIAKNVTEEFLDTCQAYGDTTLLEGEIPRVTMLSHSMKKGSFLHKAPCQNTLSLFFSIDGDVEFQTPNSLLIYKEKAVFLDLPMRELTVKADSDCFIIEVQIPKIGDLNEAMFPFSKPYYASEQYRDACKSDKSISRAVLPFGLIPGFDFGSVQTTGPDRIEQHCHPLKDQVFMSFKENGATLLIDEGTHEFKENVALHIPLGSHHGVSAKEGQLVHYLWFDFTFPERDI